MIYPGRKIIFAPDEGMPDPTLEICSAYPFGGPGAGSAVSHYYTNSTIKLNTSNANVAFGKSVFHNCTFPEKPANLDLSNWKVKVDGMSGNKGVVLGYDKTTGIVSLVRRNGFCMLVK